MAKAKKEQIEELNELIEIEADALELYDEAFGHIADPHIREALEAIEADHERHVADLIQLVLDLGGKTPPPPAGRDVKGTVVRAKHALRSATGTRGAVKALRTDEDLTRKTYEKAADVALPEPLAEVITRNLHDERRHLAIIEAMLDEDR